MKFVNRSLPHFSRRNYIQLITVTISVWGYSKTKTKQDKNKFGIINWQM